MRVNFLLHGLFFSLQLFDSVFEKFFLWLNKLHFLFFAGDDFTEFFLELALELLDSLLIFWFHLIYNFFVYINLLVQWVNDDIFLLLHVLKLIHKTVIDGLKFSVFRRFLFDLFKVYNFFEKYILGKFARSVLKVVESASAILFWWEVTNTNEFLIVICSTWE